MLIFLLTLFVIDECSIKYTAQRQIRVAGPRHLLTSTPTFENNEFNDNLAYVG